MSKINLSPGDSDAEGMGERRHSFEDLKLRIIGKLHMELSRMTRNRLEI